MPLSQGVKDWEAKGKRLEIPGTASTRIWRDGKGPPVLCLHGVPASAYLYRKVLPELAARGLEGIALDLPGMGFSERPRDFDYTWTGLGAWLLKAVDATNLREFHLVVHDVGGPVGYNLISRAPERILSLTVLNTPTVVSKFSKPFVMRTFSIPGIGLLMAKSMNTPMVFPMFRVFGVMQPTSYREIRAYGEILVQTDGGAAFIKVMKGFEPTKAFEEKYLPILAQRTFPAQVVWGAKDFELRASKEGQLAREALNLATPIHELPAKHFLQENVPEEIAERIALLVKEGKDV